jgi:acrylyl-CoA reductase (NADPH)
VVHYDCPMAFQALRIFKEAEQITARRVMLELDELSAGEVVIQVEYSSINYKDALAATGAGKILRHYPLVGGIDLAGKVVSSTDTRFTPGLAVLVTGCGLSETCDGGYAQFARVAAESVIPLPTGFDTFTAMALGTAGFTAALAIHRLEHNGLKLGQGPVLVTGASGGVGSLAIDMLTARGYQVIAVSGKPQARTYLESLGVAEILSREELTLVAAKPLSATRFAGAIDNVGGAMLPAILAQLHFQGSVASVGLTGGSELQLSVMPFLIRGVNMLGINSAATPRELRLHIWQRCATDLKPRHLAKITRCIDFEALLEAFPDYLSGAALGRTVVKLSQV